jgi:hypothetical protein
MSRKSQEKFREFHRYLGFFLAGIMAVYALSGIVLTFRNTDTFKTKETISVVVEPGLNAETLGPALKTRIRVEKVDGFQIVFNGDGVYNAATGEAKYSNTKYPVLLEKMNKLHLDEYHQSAFLVGYFLRSGITILLGICLLYVQYRSAYLQKGLVFCYSRCSVDRCIAPGITLFFNTY